MGKGTKIAAMMNPEHAQMIDDFKDQLIIALVQQLGGLDKPVSIPRQMIDDTGDKLLMFQVTHDPINIGQEQFTFRIERKQ